MRKQNQEEEALQHECGYILGRRRSWMRRSRMRRRTWATSSRAPVINRRPRPRIRDALLAKADFFNRIGDKEQAVKGYQEAYEKTVGVGAKMDNILTVIRIAFFFEDTALMKKHIDRAKVELGKGGSKDL